MFVIGCSLARSWPVYEGLSSVDLALFYLVSCPKTGRPGLILLVDANVQGERTESNKAF